MSTTAVRQQHATWLSLIDTQGPFLTLPVLTRTLHDGLEPTSKRDWNALRPAYQTWAADRNATSKGAPAHIDWVHHVVTRLLDWDTDADFDGPFDEWSHTEPEHDVTVTPAFTLNDDTGTPMVLGFIHPYDTPLTGRVKDDGWAANRLDRAAATLRASGVQFGLVTDGRWWALVWAPRGGATAHAIWDAVLWLEDRTSLDAFSTLTSRRRFLAVADDATLKGMLIASLDSQEEVTDQLGKQVRAAAKFLVESFGRADHHEGGHRLIAIDNDDIYNGAVTILMRLVFMFCAEERRLLPADSDFYLRAYSVSALADRLAREAVERGESTLEHSTAAWHQLLATFRIVHGGSSHQAFSMPGYGGSIFDPINYPWLEGDDQRGPIPVDDRTVHHILRGLTRLTFREKGVTESRKISYRALDVEQIGYVYEGLLDHTATRATDTTLGFTGKNEPEITLSDLEAQAARGDATSVAWLAKTTGLSVSAVKRGLAGPADPNARDALLRRVYAACDNNSFLAERVMAYAPLLREDPRGLPLVYLTNRLFVTSSSTRGDTGTHYTPRDLAERVVATALEALIYKPGPLDTGERDQWNLIAAADILNLRIADIAMGSGAFLVAACRYLADRLLEAILRDDSDSLAGELVDVWIRANDRVKVVATADAEVDEAVLYARRLVAERCLYGVDLNPMAVEMAKLSLWLITAARDKPFGFLDHRLIAGDSLLGLTSAAQIEYLHIDPKRGRALHADALTDHTAHVQRALREAADLRSRISATPAMDLRGVEIKRELLLQANAQLADLALLSDAIVGAGLAAAGGLARNLDAHLLRLTDHVPALLGATNLHSVTARSDVQTLAAAWLDTDRPEAAFQRHPAQWVTRFPEVFMTEGITGFDAVVGNPPFLGGKKISGAAGAAYREWLKSVVADDRSGSSDLIGYFYLLAASLTAESGVIGYIATNSLTQGDTREVSLDWMLANQWRIFQAESSRAWGKGASVSFVVTWLTRRPSMTSTLDGKAVGNITSSLTPGSRVSGPAHRLRENAKQAFYGTVISGNGFVLSDEERVDLLRREPQASEIIKPYLVGKDLNSSSQFEPARWVIDFGGRSLEQAERYPECLNHARAWVKPDRDRVKREAYRTNWWRFAERCAALYEAISQYDRVIVVAQVSNTVVPVLIPTGPVISSMVVTFAYDDYARLALLSSSMHYWWTIRQTSTLQSAIRYTPSDCFETFPQPSMTTRLAVAGEQLHLARQEVMKERAVGLTALYNDVNDPGHKSDQVVNLRNRHREVDEATMDAYGWSDLDLKHGIYLGPNGNRFTIGPDVRVEMLDRLLELNHCRYEAESRRRDTPSKARLQENWVEKDAQDDLFGGSLRGRK